MHANSNLRGPVSARQSSKLIDPVDVRSPPTFTAPQQAVVTNYDQLPRTLGCLVSEVTAAGRDVFQL